MKKIISILTSVFLLTSVFSAVSVDAAASVAISDTTATKIEFEHYVSDKAKAVNGASGGKLLSELNTTAAPNISVPIEITKSGYYNIKFASTPKSTSLSEIKFSLATKGSFDMPVNNGVASYTNLSYSGGNGQPLCLFTEYYVWIDSGVYDLKAVVSAIGGKYSYALDYIEFKLSPAPVISGTSSTRIELDDFAKLGVYSWDRGVTENKNASEGQLVFQKGGIVDPSWSIPVKVTQSGFYHVSYTTGDCTNKSYLSTVQLKLGSVILGENKTTAADKSVNLNVGAWEGTQYLYQYTNEWIWLDKGEYDITVHISITSDQFYKFHMDDITFVPAVNGISRDDDGTIKVHATYTEVKTGFLILAAYNGDTLVGTTTYHMDNEDFVDFAYQTDKPVTKVKVFIWENNSSVKPLEMYKDFTISYMSERYKREGAKL